MDSRRATTICNRSAIQILWKIVPIVLIVYVIRIYQETPLPDYTNILTSILLSLDREGLIKSGPDLSPEDLSGAHWPINRQPYLLETSLPGVFAIGDVRSGSIKRVASAVGEGSIAISFIHKVLQE